MNKTEPFAITCVTCGSRLKVTNHDLIGSIDRCPKCGGMVQITAPSKSADAHATRDPEADADFPTAPLDGRVSIGMLDDIDSAAITQSAISGLGTENLKPNSATSNNAPATKVGHETLAPPNESEIPSARVPFSDEDAAPFGREFEVPWQSESTHKTKQLVLVGLLSLFGVITAGIVFLQFVRGWREQQVATSSETETTSSSSVGGQENALGDGTEAPAPSSEPTLEVESVGPVKSIEASTPNDAPENNVAPENGLAPEPASLMGNQLAIESSDASSSGKKEVPPLVAAPFSLEPEPSEMAVIASRDDSDAVDGDEIPKMNNLPPEMQKFMPWLSLETTDRQAPPAMPPPPTIDTVRIDAAAEEANAVDAASQKRKPIEVEKLLALRYAINNKTASLSDMVLILSQLTTVPIELELVSFDAAGKRVDVPLKTPAGWLSVREWIDRLCVTEGLVVQSFGDRLMISASNQLIDEGIAPALLLDDFGDDAKAVFEMLSPLLATEESEPAQAEVAVNDAPVEDAEAMPLFQTRLSDDRRSIIPGASLRARMRAVFAIESVRLMRGMPTKLERWRTVRWMGPWPKENKPSDVEQFGDWGLVSGGKGGPRLDSPRTAAGLIQTIASLNQAKALVGWFDANRQDFFPGDLLMPFSREGTAEGMLDEVLGDRGLQARICGPGIWYVGTEASYDRFEVFTWLPTPPGSEKAIRERLANSLSIADPSSMPVAFDSDQMLVRCQRYLARQMPRIVTP